MNEEQDNDETIATDEKADVDETPRRRRAAGRGSRRTKKAKKKKSGAAPSGVKVDPEQALAYCKQRIREETDPLTKAFFQRELDGMGERLKKAEQERLAKMTYSTGDKKSLRVGDHAFILEAGSRYYQGRHEHTAPRLDEYIVKNIASVDDQYGSGTHKRLTLRHLRTGSTRTVEQGHYSGVVVYADPRSAVDKHISACESDVKDAQAQLSDATSRRDAFLALRKVAAQLASRKPEEANATPAKPRAAKTTTPKPSPDGAAGDRVGKRWTDEENETIRTEIAAGSSPEDIATILGRPRDRVVRQMHKLGVKPAAVPFHNFGRNPAGPGDRDGMDTQPLFRENAEPVTA